MSLPRFILKFICPLRLFHSLAWLKFFSIQSVLQLMLGSVSSFFNFLCITTFSLRDFLCRTPSSLWIIHTEDVTTSKSHILGSTQKLTTTRDPEGTYWVNRRNPGNFLLVLVPGRNTPMSTQIRSSAPTNIHGKRKNNLKGHYS